MDTTPHTITWSQWKTDIISQVFSLTAYMMYVEAEMNSSYRHAGASTGETVLIENVEVFPPT